MVTERLDSRDGCLYIRSMNKFFLLARLNKSTAWTYVLVIEKVALLLSLTSDFITCNLGFKFTIDNIFFCSIWICRAPCATWTACSNVLLLVSNFSMHHNHLEYLQKKTRQLDYTPRDSDSIGLTLGPEPAFLTSSQVILLLLFHRTHLDSHN